MLVPWTIVPTIINWNGLCVVGSTWLAPPIVQNGGSVGSLDSSSRSVINLQDATAPNSLGSVNEGTDRLDFSSHALIHELYSS